MSPVISLLAAPAEVVDLSRFYWIITDGIIAAPAKFRHPLVANYAPDAAPYPFAFVNPLYFTTVHAAWFRQILYNI